jgi:hypothetical protein
METDYNSIVRYKVPIVSTVRTLGSGGSNISQGMDVCASFFLFVLSCVGSGLADSPAEWSYQLSMKLIVLRLIIK